MSMVELGSRAAGLVGRSLTSLCNSAIILPGRPGVPQRSHLAFGCRAINRLAVAGCGTFFASASSDETVKVRLAACCWIRANACLLIGLCLACEMQRLARAEGCSLKMTDEHVFTCHYTVPLQVWDCRRLEKDVSFRSRLTYTAQVKSAFSWVGGRLAGLTHSTFHLLSATS